jgi:hypothetical protein
MPIASKRPESTFIIGDFNRNPWEESMIDPYLFATIPVHDFQFGVYKKDKDIAKRSYPTFYNPTWTLLGDYIHHTGERRPSGSYCFNTNDIAHIYNMFDQLLMPFEAVKHFHLPSLRLLDQIGGHELWNYRTNMVNSLYSDHLPLFFQIKVNP